MKSFPVRLSEALRRGARPALAVVLEAAGPAPQKAGAAALFGPRRLIDGTIGGGALEAAVRKAASEALRTGEARLFDRSLRGTDLAEAEEICGGSVKLLVDPRPDRHRAVFSALSRSLAAGRRGVLATEIVRDARGRISLRRDWLEGTAGSALDREIVEALSGGEPRLARIDMPGRSGAVGRLLFLEPLLPPFRLLIAGAGHVGRAVARMGSFLEFEVTVVDDRRAFANRTRLPDADHVVCGPIGASLRRMPKGRDALIVIVTRGHRSDTEALRACIGSEAGYIGMIGSRSKIALQRAEFLERGWASAAAFDRVHAPIGLPIRSKSVPEIAVSIAAELVRTRRDLMDGGGDGR